MPNPSDPNDPLTASIYNSVGGVGFNWNDLFSGNWPGGPAMQPPVTPGSGNGGGSSTSTLNPKSPVQPLGASVPLGPVTGFGPGQMTMKSSIDIENDQVMRRNELIRLYNEKYQKWSPDGRYLMIDPSAPPLEQFLQENASLITYGKNQPPTMGAGAPGQMNTGTPGAMGGGAPTTGAGSLEDYYKREEIKNALNRMTATGTQTTGYVEVDGKLVPWGEAVSMGISADKFKDGPTVFGIGGLDGSGDRFAVQGNNLGLDPLSLAQMDSSQIMLANVDGKEYTSSTLTDPGQVSHPKGTTQSFNNPNDLNAIRSLLGISTGSIGKDPETGELIPYEGGGVNPNITGGVGDGQWVTIRTGEESSTTKYPGMKFYVMTPGGYKEVTGKLDANTVYHVLREHSNYSGVPSEQLADLPQGASVTVRTGAGGPTTTNDYPFYDVFDPKTGRKYLPGETIPENTLVRLTKLSQNAEEAGVVKDPNAESVASIVETINGLNPAARKQFFDTHPGWDTLLAEAGYTIGSDFSVTKSSTTGTVDSTTGLPKGYTRNPDGSVSDGKGHTFKGGRWYNADGSVYTGADVAKAPTPAPQAAEWRDAPGIASAGGGYYYDPATGKAWTAETGWVPIDKLPLKPEADDGVAPAPPEQQNPKPPASVPPAITPLDWLWEVTSQGTNNNGGVAFAIPASMVAGGLSPADFPFGIVLYYKDPLTGQWKDVRGRGPVTTLDPNVEWAAEVSANDLRTLRALKGVGV